MAVAPDVVSAMPGPRAQPGLSESGSGRKGLAPLGAQHRVTCCSGRCLLFTLRLALALDLDKMIYPKEGLTFLLENV